MNSLMIGADHRGVGLVGEVAVAVEYADLCVGDGCCRPFGRLVDDGHAVGPGEEQCRCGDGVELAGPVLPVFLGVALSRDGRGGGEARGPQRAGAKAIDLLFGHLQDVDQHGDDGSVVVAPGERRLDALDRPGG